MASRASTVSKRASVVSSKGSTAHTKAATSHASTSDDLSSKDLAKLYPYELKWRDRHDYLLNTRGYQLRPRFREGWKPSWQKWEWLPPCIKNALLNPYGREDGLPLMFGELLMDAVRVRDGKPVVLKIISKLDHPGELSIASDLAGIVDDRNHCVPVVESFDAPDDPNRTIIVMPLLRTFNDPPFETVGEVVECVKQLLEGLQFIHEHNVAHRDCFTPNIMMEAAPLYPKPFHPSNPAKRRDWKGPAKHISRTESQRRNGEHIRYYFIDFGISMRYQSAGTHLEQPIIPSDKSVPEHQGALRHKRSDPFATDIYLIGNTFRECFLKRPGSEKLLFMNDLVSEMTATNPQLRPKIGEAVRRFASLNYGDLNERLVPDGKKSKGKRSAKGSGPSTSTAQPTRPSAFAQKSGQIQGAASTSQITSQTGPGKKGRSSKSKGKGSKKTPVKAP